MNRDLYAATQAQLDAIAKVITQLPLDEYIEEVDAQRVRTRGLTTLACSSMHDDIRRAAELARAVANVRAVIVRHGAEQRDAEAREHPVARRHPGVHAR